MTDDYKRGYSKGYNAGRGPNWPEHKPPLPPDDMVADIIKAARAMRDATDSQLAMFDEDDSMPVAIYPFIDAFDEAMTKMGRWLKD